MLLGEEGNNDVNYAWHKIYIRCIYTYNIYYVTYYKYTLCILGLIIWIFIIICIIGAKSSLVNARKISMQFKIWFSWRGIAYFEAWFLQYRIFGRIFCFRTMHRIVNMTEAFHPTSKHRQANRILTGIETQLLNESIFGEQRALDILYKN